MIENHNLLINSGLQVKIFLIEIFILFLALGIGINQSNIINSEDLLEGKVITFYRL